MSSVIRILVVDDHPIVRDGIIGMVTGEPDLEVVGEASSGPEAVSAVAALTPDLVLMDLRMPGGGGVAAIRELRRQGSAPRILVLTTYDTDRDIRAAMTAGADGYLLKDTRRADLLRGIRDVAAGRPVLASGVLASLVAGDRVEALSERELEVLRVIANGGTNRTAAGQLFVSEATVKTHLAHIYDKLGVGDRAAAVRVAYERGLL